MNLSQQDTKSGSYYIQLKAKALCSAYALLSMHVLQFDLQSVTHSTVTVPGLKTAEAAFLKIAVIVKEYRVE